MTSGTLIKATAATVALMVFDPLHVTTKHDPHSHMRIGQENGPVPGMRPAAAITNDVMVRLTGVSAIGAVGGLVPSSS